MFLTHLPHKGCLLDKALMRKKTKELFERMNLELDPNTMVRDLDASYKQIVEISRALMQDASIIIMDEPTTSLTEPEIQRVFAMMRTLKEQGVGIIFISHKLGEVMEICDRYTVLRDGCMVAQGLVKDTNSKKLAEYMVGHEIRTESLKRDQNYGDEMLRLENLSDGKHFRDISLSVRAGQVLGITGLLGDGRSELFQTVFGAMGGHYTGKVVIGGKEVHLTDTHQALLEGLAYLPRNRKENAILKDMSILDNGTIVQLPKFVRGLFINKNQQQEAFRIQQEKLRIKMGDKYDLITSLSGGNQQKVVLAKWVMSDPKVLILDNPSQGVDVGAKEEIYGIIHRLAQEGVAIVVLSSEAQEIIRVCDSSLVMYHGRIVGHVSGEDMNEKHIMYLATGGNQSENRGGNVTHEQQNKQANHRQRRGNLVEEQLPVHPVCPAGDDPDSGRGAGLQRRLLYGHVRQNVDRLAEHSPEQRLRGRNRPGHVLCHHYRRHRSFGRLHPLRHRCGASLYAR